MIDEPTARVEVGPDGQLSLHDPVAEGVIAAITAYNRKIAFTNLQSFVKRNEDRINHFVTRIRDRGDSWQDFVVVCIQVDDPFGAELAELLMPGHDWQVYRDRGEIPVARGLASRAGIEAILKEFRPEAGKALSETRGYAAVIVGEGTALAIPWEGPPPDTFWARLLRV